MKFSVGDKVLFKKESLRGKVSKIISIYKVLVLTQDGFESLKLFLDIALGFMTSFCSIEFVLHQSYQVISILIQIYIIQ